MEREPIEVIRLNGIYEVVEIPEFQQIEYKTVIKDGGKYYVGLEDFAAHILGVNPDIINDVSYTEDCLTVYCKEDISLDFTILDQLYVYLTKQLNVKWWIKSALRTKNIDSPYEETYSCLAINISMNFIINK